ncbi:hypothetical protein MSBR3_2011 [Methanosarcina barkeri 3]|uniref:Uncharacterized protein n=1 Tax=Methanosarcina barkeri 3 TaxID=1434107 RepID=A0A0E3WWA0_METBA|nr:hypothetical protein MSBR3_2011 [Methanosarcina barkeri 3]
MLTTETELFQLFVIYAYDSAGEALCSVTADAAEETKIKYKITVTDAKAIECSFLLMFIILPLFNLFFYNRIVIFWNICQFLAFSLNISFTKIL